MKKQILILLMVGHGAIMMAQQKAADTLYFSLDEAMLFAMENNLNAMNARLDVDAADQRVVVFFYGLAQVRCTAIGGHSPVTQILACTKPPARAGENQAADVRVFNNLLHDDTKFLMHRDCEAVE